MTMRRIDRACFVGLLGLHLPLLAWANAVAMAAAVAAADSRPAAAAAATMELAQAQPAAAPAPTPASAPAPAAQRTAAAGGEAMSVAAALSRRFDLAVNNAPAAQVFLQMAQGTPMNMLVPPDVSGSVTLSLRDVTLVEALESMRDLYGYDFRITGNRVLVHSNSVQTRMYRVNYLPGRRQGASDVRITSSSIAQVGLQQSHTGGSVPTAQPGADRNAVGARSDDSAHVRTTSDADFWREVQQALVTLVGAERSRSVIVNPAAGLVVAKATPAELRQVEAYLKAVQLSIERQVMLEAKIVQVSLSREAQTGINWGSFARNLANGSLALGVVAPGSTLSVNGNLSSQDGVSIATNAGVVASALSKGFYGLAFQSASFAALLNFLQTQGDVSVLSSPRIATLNNQKAVLKVGSDELYVTGVTTSTTTSGNSTVSTPTLQLQPFFSGIALDVTPQIDDAGRVILHVHPTVSVVSEKNKNIDLGSLGSYRLPLAASTVNETDSIVRVSDGQIAAIGGLMQQEIRDERSGVPVLSDVPLLGGLFRQSGTVNSKRELVILIKPTVLRDDAVASAVEPVLPSPGR